MTAPGGPILVMNPNSNAAVTQAMAEALAPFTFADGPPIRCTTLDAGPFGIESQEQADAVILPLLRQARTVPEALAVVIACYSDPGLDTLREALPCPVFGIQESGVLAALARADRIGIIGLSDASAARHQRYMRRMGVLARVAGERVVDLSVDDAARGADAPERLAEAAHGLRADGAGAVVLGCAGMAAHRTPVEAAVGIPVIDPVQAAVAQALGAVLPMMHGDP